MSHEPLESLTPAERSAREAVRALPAVAPAPEFRERLKGEFASGRIERRVLALPFSWHRGRAWRLALAGAAAAALMAVVTIANRGPSWTVSGADGAGVAVIDRAPVPMNHVPEQAWRLRPGARVRLPEDARLELAGGALRLEIEGGSEAVLPATPGRWFGRAVEAGLETGVLRVATGPDFTGARLRVLTPEAEVTVTGTTLAVIREPAGTCVCVHEGEVMVGVRGAAAEPVTAGRRRFIFKDGRPAESGEIRPGERERLGTMGGHGHH